MFLSTNTTFTTSNLVGVSGIPGVGVSGIPGVGVSGIPGVGVVLYITSCYLVHTPG